MLGIPLVVIFSIALGFSIALKFGFGINSVMIISLIMSMHITVKEAENGR